jgi:hypothetical protein
MGGRLCHGRGDRLVVRADCARDGNLVGLFPASVVCVSVFPNHKVIAFVVFAYMCLVWVISRTPCCSDRLVNGDADFSLFILLCSDPLAIDIRILPFPACKGLLFVPLGDFRFY